MAAENSTGGAHAHARPPGFNEAAANGRGKLCTGGAAGAAGCRFNEAAANGRGKPPPPPRLAVRAAPLQ